MRISDWSSDVCSSDLLDVRLAALLAPLIGTDLKQIINQMHWKPPGAARVAFAYHQDSRFRRPASAFRPLAGPHVQTGTAIRPHHRHAGASRPPTRAHTPRPRGPGGQGRSLTHP